MSNNVVMPTQMSANLSYGGKSRKNIKNKKGGKTRKCRYSATMHGLNHWHKHMFEHLGWMILAKEKYNTPDKIATYKKSIDRLKEAIECKINTVEDKDKKADLQILWDNIMILKKHVEKDF